MKTTSPEKNGKILIPTIIILGTLALSIPIYLFLVRPRVATQKQAEEILAPTPRTVNVVPVLRSAATTELTLPATAEAFQDISVYARVNGYLKSWRTDIGDQVKAGDAMAEIDSPEVDEGLNQAAAKLGQAQQEVENATAKLAVVRASRDLAKTTAARWQRLGAAHAVSQQEVDEKTGTLAEQDALYMAAQSDIRRQEAALEAAKADVKHFRNLKDFETVRAPFAGVVSARTVDVGQLINEGRTGKELFRLTQGDTLRVHVRIPQVFVRSVEPGIPAEFLVGEFPDRSFTGKVVRTSGVVDPASRTLLAEVHIPNPDGKLLVGSYGQIRLRLKLAHEPLLIPSNAVMVDARGARVITVDTANTVHWRKVELGRDFGASVEILGGLKEGERVVPTPSDGFADGEVVAPETSENSVKKEEK